MELAIMEQIITMVGGATESAVTIAILWIVGGYLVTLFGWGVFVYVLHFLVGTFYKYLTVEVSKEEYAALKDELARKSKYLTNATIEINVMKAEHKIELEKVKHLYQILKDENNKVVDDD